MKSNPKFSDVNRTFKGRVLPDRVQSMPVPYAFAIRRIVGGPFPKVPRNFWSLKMAKEIRLPCNFEIPTQDFGLPDKSQMVNGVREVLLRLAMDENVFVGCAGGIGRTGTFLGCLVRATGEPKPIAYVRRHYLRGAIETEAQEDFVMNFPTMRWYFARCCVLAWVFDRFSRITAYPVAKVLRLR